MKISRNESSYSYLSHLSFDYQTLLSLLHKGSGKRERERSIGRSKGREGKSVVPILLEGPVYTTLILSHLTACLTPFAQTSFRAEVEV